ncbi:CHC2 zinc finger domain-containing protein [Roseovarius sp.]|uniref:CHC2 zinc finger domain-containing protein n=1 Tax=Roseovarius sp. TaxID=1486281 RepID=UPI003D100B7E
MCLPRDLIDEVRARSSLTKLAGRSVVWDPRKSNPGKGEMWAKCPFKIEKSVSFRVDESKGYYYCFDCKAKGDVFRFVREMENAGFEEAVRILAVEAGIPFPETNKSIQRALAYITCKCSCGRVSEVSSDKLEPILGKRLTSANALSLISKLRCTECQSSPAYLYDDKGRQLFGPTEAGAG